MQEKEMKSSYTNNKLAITTHILGILTFFLGSLLVKKFSKDTNAKLHAKFALNWQINVILYIIVGLIMKVILIGYIIIPAVLVLNIAFSTIAAIKASKNELWTYPLAFQFLE